MAMSASHFLKLYQESSERLLLLLQQSFDVPSMLEYRKPTKDFIISRIRDNYLQELYDCLHGSNYKKSTLLLWFGRKYLPEFFDSISLFEIQLQNQLLQGIFGNSLDIQNYFLAMFLLPGAEFEWQSKLSNLSIEVAIAKLKELDSFKDIDSAFSLFKNSFNTSLLLFEFDSDFLMEEVESFVANMKLDLGWFEYLRENILRSTINQLRERAEVDQLLIDQLKELSPGNSVELEEIASSHKEQHLKESVAAFKESLPSFFEKLFKDLQTIFRSKFENLPWIRQHDINSVSVISHLSTVTVPTSAEVGTVLAQFEVSVMSKVNIIITMFRNQCANSDNSHFLNKFYGLVRFLSIQNSSSFLEHFVSQFISEPILIEWNAVVLKYFEKMHLRFGREFSICCLSNLFITANVEQRHRQKIIETLGITNVVPNLLHFGIAPITE